MTETLTIPAHLENGVVLLDGPLPRGVESIEVRVTLRSARKGRISSLIKYLESLPLGTRTREEIDAEIREGREGVLPASAAGGRRPSLWNTDRRLGHRCARPDRGCSLRADSRDLARTSLHHGAREARGSDSAHAGTATKTAEIASCPKGGLLARVARRLEEPANRIH